MKDDPFDFIQASLSTYNGTGCNVYLINFVVTTKVAITGLYYSHII